MTAPEHEHSAAIDEAARFLAATPQPARPRPIVPALKAMFGIDAKQACEAIREASRGAR